MAVISGYRTHKKVHGTNCMDCFSQQSEVFISVTKAHACMLSELIMKLVCPGFAGKANKLNT